MITYHCALSHKFWFLVESLKSILYLNDQMIRTEQTYLMLGLYIFMSELQRGDVGQSSSSIVPTPIVLLPQTTGPSQLICPTNTNMEVSSDSMEEKGANEVLVRIHEIMDVGERSGDSLQTSVLSRINDLEGCYCCSNVTHLHRILHALGCRESIVSLQWSEAEYSSNRRVFVSIDGPLSEGFYDCTCSSI